MKKITLSFISLLLAACVLAQNPGDTIVVKGFKYGSSTRDTVLNFPNNPSLSFEKIILKYNMRCKNAMISNQTFPNQGCGEWDYSCNTFIVDSTRIEEDLNQQPSHVISGFNGTTFNYVTQPVFDFYNFSQTNVQLNNIVSENQYNVGAGTTPLNLFGLTARSGRSQFLYTAAELTTAGFTAGNIDAFLLNNNGSAGTLNFFKVGIRHSTAANLDPNAPVLTGFTNVFNQNFTFAAGSNRIQFHTPFVWDGVSNVLIDLSFTNTVPQNNLPVTFASSATPTLMSMAANNNYALDLSAYGHAALNPAQLSNISNELSITFWAYGNAALMPVNTVLLYGYSPTAAQRQLNLHMPWGDGQVYFDAGYSNGGFDRIQKSATAAEQGGQWNHWAFTKNAATGNMRIYLNGALWFSGSGKTKPITLLNLILGKDADLVSNYKGRINELTIWSQELTATDIQGWMNKPVTNVHPAYGNLIAYYKLNEGTGLVINDTKNSLTSTGVNLQWTYDRGDKLTRMFSAYGLRPNLAFLRGTYAMATTTVITKDSIARNPNIVMQYSIASNAQAVPMTHDAVVLASTTDLYGTTPSNVYDGDTGVLTGTLAVTPAGAINITNLPYYKRYPYYNELLSFVTPYGKGLDMGVRGKTWYYDVTDFTPLLKGPRRMLMTMGGENQEQMDIDFWFIVGTPPRNVVAFKQLWQGGARLGGVGIGSINDDSRFTISSEPLAASAQAFKLRSTITGHGAQGEFSQNGGQVTHLFNINGGADEFSWIITENCTRNVIFPQGGTWVYNRQGWCPGQTSLMKEYDLTPLVTPGTTVTMDYNCSNPQVANGDYRYIVANQLVSYGGANHSNDACVVDVLAPSNRVLYSRKNPICSSPVILVRNTGSSPLTSLDIEYWCNNASVKQVYNWAGSLAYMDTVSIVLPIATLWQDDILPSNNMFHVELKKANGVVDDYSFNNFFHSSFTLPDVIPQDFMIEFKTNTYYFDNNYTLLDEFDNVVGSSNFTAANTIYQDSYLLAGCFKLVVQDYGGDGLSWWANTAQGNGYARIKNNVTGQILKTFQPDFGGGFEYSFSTIQPVIVALQKNALDASLKLYPNPAQHKFILEGAGVEGAAVVVNDVIGRSVAVPSVKKQEAVEFNTTALPRGIYFVTITKGGESVTKKVVVN